MSDIEQEYQNYRMLMYSGGYEPVSYEEWQGIMYKPDVSEVERLQAENARLREALEGLQRVLNLNNNLRDRTHHDLDILLGSMMGMLDTVSKALEARGPGDDHA